MATRMVAPSSLRACETIHANAGQRRRRASRRGCATQSRPRSMSSAPTQARARWSPARSVREARVTDWAHVYEVHVVNSLPLLPQAGELFDYGRRKCRSAQLASPCPSACCGPPFSARLLLQSAAVLPTHNSQLTTHRRADFVCPLVGWGTYAFNYTIGQPPFSSAYGTFGQIGSFNISFPMVRREVLMSVGTSAPSGLHLVRRGDCLKAQRLTPSHRGAFLSVFCSPPHETPPPAACRRRASTWCSARRRATASAAWRSP